MCSQRTRISRDPAVRLAPFIEQGLITELPTRWQWWQGQVEMGPYVVRSDEGDAARYAGARFGRPLVRTPLVFSQIGLDHLRIGHGMHAKEISVLKHMAIVYHEGFPTFDLQLVQTFPDGLDHLRAYFHDLIAGATRRHRRVAKVAGMILPDPHAYWHKFLEPGGWIDRAAAFQYPDDSEVPGYLRLEFMSLVGFTQHCLTAYPAKVAPRTFWSVPSQLWSLATAVRRPHKSHLLTTTPEGPTA